MTTLLHLLDEEGNFEQLDSEHLHLYSHFNAQLANLIELSDEQAEELNQLTGHIRYVDGKFIAQEWQAVEIPLETAKQNAIKELGEKTDKLTDALLADYPKSEMSSFYRQEQEARAFMANNNSPCAMLGAIAQKRGIPLALLAEKVIEKADYFAWVTGQILGEKQRIESAIQVANSKAEIDELMEDVRVWRL